MSDSRSATGARSGWLFGPISDLGIGCGLLFWAFFAWMAFAGDSTRALLPMALAPVIGILIGQPHYGATLLRVYEHREDRRSYALFAVFGSALIWAAFAVGVHNDIAGSLLLTFYLTIAPWHYAGQNYGIAMMLMRRKGAEISYLAQRAFHASFVLSTLLTILSLHGPARPNAEYAFVAYQGSAYNFMSLGMSAASKDIAVLLLAGAYLASLIAAGFLLKRKATLQQLLPAAAISATQALWFGIPVVTRHFGLFGQIEPLSAQHAAYTIFWVSVGHSIQYLWVTTYFSGRAKHPSRGLPFYTKAVLAGTATFAIPTLLFAPGFLGRVSIDAGLLVMISAAVNLHHYLLDAVIWKLRHSRIAKVLILDEDPDQSEPEPSASWVRPALVSLGVLSVTLMSIDAASTHLATRAIERQDPSGLSSAIRALSWIRRDSATLYFELSTLHQERGEIGAAIENAARAEELHDRYAYDIRLCALYSQAQRNEEGVKACRHVLASRPRDPIAAMNLALLLARNADRSPAELNEAIGLAELASEERHQQDPYFLKNLALIYRAAERRDDMQRSAIRALEIASAQHNSALEAQLRIMITKLGAELAAH
ncbi:MAG: hypothetical protein IH881_02490 [Myxococcales bacterium]|nr:hypothetical protein [Myxococcales bacterium]